MEAKSTDFLTPGQLALLLDFERPSMWGADDAAAALQHQLAAPLLPDLAGQSGENRGQPGPASEWDRLQRLVEEQDASSRTFVGQLTAARPSLPLLESIKQFARQLRDESASPMRDAPATVLYYAAIAAALIHCRARITQLTDEQIREGCQWAQDQAGTADLRALFKAAVASLDV